jgi:ribosomal protein L40E
MTDEVLASVAVGILIFVGLFFLFRELLNWYWKNNARLNELRMQTRLLMEIKNLLMMRNTGSQEVTTQQNFGSPSHPSSPSYPVNPGYPINPSQSVNPIISGNPINYSNPGNQVNPVEPSNANPRLTPVKIVCSKCGNPLPEGAKFCDKCGAYVL